MGLRFRKSVNLGGGAKVNFSKSGVGYSVGTKGGRITKKADGGTRTTLSAPGTGLSYVTETGSVKGAKKKGNILLWLLWLIGWILIFPLPVTILLLRKKNINVLIRLVVIIAAWIAYVLIVVGLGTGGSPDAATAMINHCLPGLQV